MGVDERDYLLFKEKFGEMGKEDLEEYKKVYYTVDDGRILDILDGVESGAILKDKIGEKQQICSLFTPMGHIYAANRQATHLLYDKICETYSHCAMIMMGLQTKEEAEVEYHNWCNRAPTCYEYFDSLVKANKKQKYAQRQKESWKSYLLSCTDDEVLKQMQDMFEKKLPPAKTQDCS